MKYQILFLITIISLSATAQRQMKPLYNLNDQGMKKSGWHFSPGTTYMIPSKKNTEIETEVEGVSKELTSAGRVGLYAEVGRHHLFDKFYFLNHLDYGLAYKKLTGRQESQIICETCDLEEPVRSIFKDNFASVYVNFNNIWQISSYSFIQNGIGFNGDYRFLLNNETIPKNQPEITPNSPKPFQVQLHYKLSFGLKAEKGTFIVPSIEIPLLNIVPWDSGRGTLRYFESGYRPIIFSLKFLFLSKRKPEDCKGSGTGASGSKLWGEKMKR
jgi:hypothetical protein